MKKIIVFLLFTFFSVNLFSQPSFARAFEFHLGFKPTKNSKITWTKGGEVDLLVVISESLVKIYSSEIQEYRIVSDGEKFTDDGNSYVKYLAVDKSGLQCILYLGTDIDSDIFTIIEYGDYAWMYYLKPND